MINGLLVFLMFLSAVYSAPAVQPPAEPTAVYQPPSMTQTVLTGYLSQYDETPTRYTIEHQQAAGRYVAL